jgi:tricorn protease
MRRTTLITGACALALAAFAAAGVPAHFMQFPDIRGDVIVFTYEGDLWKAPAVGGAATRLTTYPANETAAKISPDGASIAFTGSYEGAPSLYLMPIDGGVPRRLTYTGSGVQAVAWTPDGSKVVFRSGHENTFRPIVKLFAVGKDGGFPEKLPPDRGILCSYNADGSQIVYNRRGNEEYYWKRYKGGQYTEIWLYDFKTKEFQPLTDYVGKNAYPMWIGSTMFFVSDRGPNGIANIYAYDFASKKVEQVTTFSDFDVQTPSTDGKSIVFVHAGSLGVLDVASRKLRELKIEVPSDRWQLGERVVNPRDYIHAMGVANDGKAAVFEARGDIFYVPTDENAQTRNLTNTSGVRERWPQL